MQYDSYQELCYNKVLICYYIIVGGEMKKLLNVHVYDDLLKKIQNGYYAVGDRLPTEMEMQEIYNVSRAPIRQALGSLQAEGLIERKPGIGTVVVESPGNGPWTAMGGFSFQFSKKWANLNVRTLDVVKVIPEKAVCDALKVSPNTSVVRVTRIRFENEVPVFLLNSYYSDVDIEKIRGAGEILNMRQFAAETLGVDFSYVSEELVATLADDLTSFYMKVEHGYPLLKIRRTSFDRSYKPVEYVEYFVRSDKWPYRITYSNDMEDLEVPNKIEKKGGVQDELK